jgi:predicted N-acetyltransferase YhbS
MRKQLASGLVLRTAETQADVDKLAAFNVAIHEEEGLDPFVRDLCSANHPTMSLEDFWLIEDPTTGEVASSLCLIPQRWSYEGVEFPVARMELVGTAEDYRQQGLFRQLNEVFNARTAERGMNVQAITGIPHFYRSFGYEYALELLGRAHIAFSMLPDTPTDTLYSLRRATLDDIPTLMQAYQRYTEPLAVHQVRSRAEWQYRVANHTPGNIGVPLYFLIMKDEQPVGYVSISLDTWEKQWLVDELSTTESPVNLMPWLVAALRDMGLEAEERDPDRLVFQLGQDHEVYDHLRLYNPYLQDAYGWYLRLLDVYAFLQVISPVLEQRVAESPLRGLTKSLTMRLYTQNITLHFERGKLTMLEQHPRSLEEGHLQIPVNLFYKLLFGYRSLHEIGHVHPDVAAYRWARPLVEVLFPKRRSWATPLN